MSRSTVLLALRREILTTEALFLYFLWGTFIAMLVHQSQRICVGLASRTYSLVQLRFLNLNDKNIKVSLGKLRLSLQRGFLWHDHRCHQTPKSGERSTSTGKSKAAWVENILWTRGPAYWSTIVVKVFRMNFLQQHRCNYLQGHHFSLPQTCRKVASKVQIPLWSTKV